MQATPVAAGQRATWIPGYYGRNPRMGYDYRCFVLSVQKKTARIEVRRNDGTIKRRFVKLERLYGR